MTPTDLAVWFSLVIGIDVSEGMCYCYSTNNNNSYLHEASSWQTKIKQVIAQCRPSYNAKLRLVFYYEILSLTYQQPITAHAMELPTWAQWDAPRHYK